MNNSFGLRDSDLIYIKQLLSITNEVERAFIFGSRSTMLYKKGSDVDIAIEGKKIDSGVVAHLKYILEEESLIPYFFDIVDYTHLQNKTLKTAIRQNCVIFYERN